MRQRKWWGALLVLALVATFPAAPVLADHETRVRTANITPLGHSLAAGNFNDQVATGVNSDLAFWGDTLYNGNYNGFRVVDITDPTAATLPSEWYKKCEGGQGDIIVWGTGGEAGAELLIRAWDSPSPAGRFCGELPPDPLNPLDPRAPRPVPTGFEGLHVFDVRDPQNIELVSEINLSNAAMQAGHGVTGCGSHTLTMASAVAVAGKILIYGNHSGGSCNGLDVVEIDTTDFTPCTAAPCGEGASNNGNWLRREPAGRACHDVSVFLGDVNRVACAGGNGFTLWSIDAADGGSVFNPKQLYSQPVQDVSIGHSATFTWDGTRMVFGHEPGGGSQAQCQRDSLDANKKFFIYDITGKLAPSLLGTWFLPRDQTSTENCTLHNFAFIPTTDGKDIQISGNYQAGTWAVDMTNPANAQTVAFSDPAPLDPNTLILGGAWSTYWYNGYLYESDITKGVHVHQLNDPSVANQVTLPYLNPQTQLQRFSDPVPQNLVYNTSTTIRHRNTPHQFRGRVSSNGADCVPGRKVVVKKASRGMDITVGRDTTDATGRWSVRHNRGRAGGYYAQVERESFASGIDTITCRAGESNTLRVRR